MSERDYSEPSYEETPTDQAREARMTITVGDVAISGPDVDGDILFESSDFSWYVQANVLMQSIAHLLTWDERYKGDDDEECECDECDDSDE